MWGKAVAWKLQLDLPGNQKLVFVNFLVNLWALSTNCADTEQFFFLTLYCTEGQLIFPRMRLRSSLKHMKTGRWCLLFRQMKLVCWRADVQAPALPAFSWKGEATRRAAAATAAVSNIKSGAVNICPWLMHRQTCRHCSADRSRSLMWKRCVWLIQRQESELKFTSGACRHQPENKLRISDIYQASE